LEAALWECAASNFFAHRERDPEQAYAFFVMTGLSTRPSTFYRHGRTWLAAAQPLAKS
jgi:hypothetical protein